MALLAGSLTNVYRSLDAYLQANLLDSAGNAITLRLHGVRRFVPPPVDPWIEAHYDFLNLDNQFLNLAGPSMSGARPQPVATERRGYLQLNCYQRARVFSQRYTTAAVRDLVVDAFPDGGLLPIYDWVDVDSQGGTPVQEGTLVWEGCRDHLIDTGINSGVVQHVVQIGTRYWEIQTRA